MNKDEQVTFMSSRTERLCRVAYVLSRTRKRSRRGRREGQRRQRLVFPAPLDKGNEVSGYLRMRARRRAKQQFCFLSKHLSLEWATKRNEKDVERCHRLHYLLSSLVNRRWLCIPDIYPRHWFANAMEWIFLLCNHELGIKSVKFCIYLLCYFGLHVW